ncbi:hypothetical protein L9F63_003916, partial [Diploptera punctata]
VVKRARKLISFSTNQYDLSSYSNFYESTYNNYSSSKAEKQEQLPTALPSTSKSWDAQGRSNVQYPGGSRTHFGNDQQGGQSPGKTLSQYEKGYQYGVGKAALDKHVENALLKSELYGDPSAVNQYRYYGGATERKRSQHLTYQPPSKRSYRSEIPFVMPPDDLTNTRSRLKRDLELDPEDVLAVLSLWEAEHRAKSENNPGVDPAWYNYYGVDTPDPFQEEEEDGGEEDDDNSQMDGGWLEGPVAHPSTSSHRYRLERRGGYYYPMQYPMYPAQKRVAYPKDKRFMVTRKRQVNTARDEAQTLAQLLSHQYRDPAVPLRRVVL